MDNRLLMTIGYQGLKPEDFLEKLKENNVSLLVDVRQNPISRKPGFSKTRLETLLQENDIDYVHLQRLGTPRELRQDLKDNQDFEAFLEKYQAYLGTQEESLQKLKDLIEELNCCLMCFEKDYQECHRQAISSTIEEMFNDNIEVRHII